MPIFYEDYFEVLINCWFHMVRHTIFENVWNTFFITGCSVLTCFHLFYWRKLFIHLPLDAQWMLKANTWNVLTNKIKHPYSRDMSNANIRKIDQYIVSTRSDVFSSNYSKDHYSKSSPSTFRQTTHKMRFWHSKVKNVDGGERKWSTILK